MYSLQNKKENKETEKISKQESLGIKTKRDSRVTPSANPTSSPTPTKSLPSITPTPIAVKPSHYVYLGMWTQGLWNDPTLSFSPTALTQVQNTINKKMAIAHFYTGWENLGRDSLRTQLDAVSNNGWRPMVSANPYFTADCQQNGKTIYKAIADGNCDELVKKVGRNLKAYGRPILLRFAWEMNIESMGWSIQKTGSNPTDFVSAWRRVHDITRNEGATNILWVFSPNIITPTSIAYNSLYPGDAYVDWVGLDGYNWGNTQSWSKWENFSQVFSQSYNALVSIAPSKPLMLAEVNTTDAGGDKALWYKDMLQTQIPYNFPAIKAVIFYNEDRSGTEHVNWLINSSQLALQSFIQSINNPTYLSSF